MLHQQKNFGLCRFLVQCPFQDSCTLCPPQVFYALSSTNMILFESYLALQLGNIVATVLEKNNSVHLLDSFHCLLLFCHSIYTGLSSSHLCYHQLLGALAFALINHLVTVSHLIFYLQVSICVLTALIEEAPSPKQPQTHLDGVTQILSSIAVISTKNLPCKQGSSRARTGVGRGSWTGRAALSTSRTDSLRSQSHCRVPIP